MIQYLFDIKRREGEVGYGNATKGLSRVVKIWLSIFDNRDRADLRKNVLAKLKFGRLSTPNDE